MRLLPRHFSLYVLIHLILTAAAASAQPVDTAEGDSGRCVSQETALLQEMDVARAAGRMLRRSQLADQLAELQSRCATLAPLHNREVRTERLQREILDLRKELDRAETELRALKQGT